MSKKGEIVIKKCNTCGRAFESAYSGGAINCPECTRDKKKQFERIYTKDTVFLVCKWYGEGMTVKKLAGLLNRSEDNIRKALERGGVQL